VTAFRAVVLEHFRRPRNRGPLAEPTVSVEGANPLCGDRIRVELTVSGDRIVAAGFTADACAICIAAASMLTDRIHAMTTSEAARVDAAWLTRALEGDPPAGRTRCATLPLDTLQRAITAVREAGVSQ
jgi:nitrogen fixation protein NifU and related proteins